MSDDPDDPMDAHAAIAKAVASEALTVSRIAIQARANATVPDTAPARPAAAKRKPAAKARPARAKAKPAARN